MIRRPIPLQLRLLLAFLSIVLLVVSYGWLSHRQHVRNPNDATIPGWSQLVDGVHKMATPRPRKGNVWIVDDGRATLVRFGQGLFLGIVGALLLGFLMGCWTPAEAFFTPPITIASKLNPIAMLAVFLVLAGTGEALYLAMVVFGILPALAMTTYLAVKYDVPEELIHKSYTLGASHSEIIVNVIGRQVFPKVLEGIRAQIGPALVYLIAAEMLAGDVGFGYRIRLQSRLLDMKVAYPYIALLALFGYMIDLFIVFLLGKLCPWYVKSDEKVKKEGILGTLIASFRGRKEED